MIMYCSRNSNHHTPTEWAVVLTAVEVGAGANNSSTIWVVTTTRAMGHRVATICREPRGTGVRVVVTAISTGKMPLVL